MSSNSVDILIQIRSLGSRRWAALFHTDTHPDFNIHKYTLVVHNRHAHSQTELINHCDLLWRFKHHKTLPLFTPMSKTGQLPLNGAQIIQCTGSAFHCQDDFGGVQSGSGTGALAQRMNLFSASLVSHQSQINTWVTDRHIQKRKKKKHKLKWNMQIAHDMYGTQGTSKTIEEVKPVSTIYIRDTISLPLLFC